MTEQTSVRRCCIECGAAQHAERQTVEYRESGLRNVTLLNVPVWVCENGHEETEIPAVTQLHELLAHMIIRKPAPLVGPEIRFLRRRLGLTAKDFATAIALSPVRLSQLENTPTGLHKRADLLIRLVAAAMIATRDSKPFPTDLGHLIEALKHEVLDMGSHRLRHNDLAVTGWEEAA